MFKYSNEQVDTSNIPEPVRKCKNDPNKFCICCGKYIFKNNNSRNIDVITGKLFTKYFDTKIDNDRAWAPQKICDACRILLHGWKNHKNIMPFSVPMIWRIPSNHDQECYFCLFDHFKAFRAKRYKKPIVYPDVPTAIKPVPNDPNIPAPIYDATDDIFIDEDSTENVIDDPLNKTLSENAVDLYIKKYKLPKNAAEGLLSLLHETNVISSGNVTRHRNRQSKISKFFTELDKIIHCNDIKGLMEELNTSYNPEDWALFVDSNMLSLKMILLHKTNAKKPVVIVYGRKCKESYQVFKDTLEKISYKTHGWNVVGDFKVLLMLAGLQGGFPKYHCLFCLWNSRMRHQHYVKKGWGARSYLIGNFNQILEPLINIEKIYIPPLHILLGIFSIFIKNLEKDSESFIYFHNHYNLSKAKAEAGVANGPLIKKIFEDKSFLNLLSIKEKKAFEALKKFNSGFLGSHKSENYKILAQELVESFHRMGCNMTMKLHVIHEHIEKFPLNNISDQVGERMHQDIKRFEARYKARNNINMISDFIWNFNAI